MKKSWAGIFAKFFFVFFLLAIFSALSSHALFAFEDSTPHQVILHVAGCNTNFICEPITGEDFMNCPSDCAAPTPTPTPTPIVSSTPIPSSAPFHEGNVSLFTPGITDVSVNAGSDSATVSWKTKQISLDSFVWGQTLLFESGGVSDFLGSFTHSASLENLVPDTKYYFRIDAHTAFFGSQTYIGSFTTASLLVNTRPPNVTEVSAILSPTGAEITWKNPDIDFDEILVTRSPFFYPLAPDLGRIVYEGKGASVFDTALEIGKRYFYTIFVRGKDGAYSSGTVYTLTVGTQPPSQGGVLPKVVELSLSDFIFSQNRPIVPKNGRILINATLPTRITWTKWLDMQDAKALIVSVFRDEIQSSFLFQKDEETKSFSTDVPVFPFRNHAFTISIYNVKGQTIAETRGEFVVEGTESPKQAPFWPSVRESLVSLFALFWSLILWIIHIILAFFVWLWHFIVGLFLAPKIQLPPGSV